MARSVLCGKGVIVCAVVVVMSGWVGSAGVFADATSEIEQAIGSYGRVADEYRDYERAWHALFMVGRCYEELGRTGAMSKSEAAASAREAYEGVVERYPGSPAARIAKDWLKNHQSN